MTRLWRFTRSLLLILVFASFAYADSGVVMSVMDGDTVKVRLDKTHKEVVVRYLMIDTPETSHPGRGAEEYGAKAKKANNDLVDNKRVRLESDVEKFDRYGRTLAHVWVMVGEREILVGEYLALNGLALKMQIGKNIKHEDRIDAAVFEARDKKAGFWRMMHRDFELASLWGGASNLRGRWMTVHVPVPEIKKSKNSVRVSSASAPIQIYVYSKNARELLGKTTGVNKISIYGVLSLDKRGWFIRVIDDHQLLRVLSGDARQ